MVRKAAVLVAVLTSSAPSLAYEQVLPCSAPESDRVRFVAERVDPLLALPLRSSSEKWADSFASNRKENEEKLASFCQERPQANLWVAFSELFDSD